MEICAHKIKCARVPVAEEEVEPTKEYASQRHAEHGIDDVLHCAYAGATGAIVHIWSGRKDIV